MSALGQVSAGRGGMCFLFPAGRSKLKASLGFIETLSSEQQQKAGYI